MAFESRALDDFGAEPAADLLTRGFADYVLKIQFTGAALAKMVKADSIDLAASRVLIDDGLPVAAALIARRGQNSRLASMAVVKEARNRGVGRALMDALIVAARDRGDQRMVLEVIEQNLPALRLYEGMGFGSVRRLVGFESAVIPDGPVDLLPEGEDLGAMAAVVSRDGLPDLPWQISGETLRHLAPPSRAFRLEGARIALANLDTSPVAIRGMVAEGGQAGMGGCVRLLRALMARYPGKQWRIPALWPEELSGAFVQAGFTRSAMSQKQMELRVDSLAATQRQGS